MAQTKTDNQNNTINPRMVKVAVRITPETIDELRAMYAHQEQRITIRMVKIGGWRYPCAIHLLPEEAYGEVLFGFFVVQVGLDLLANNYGDFVAVKLFDTSVKDFSKDSPT